MRDMKTWHKPAEGENACLDNVAQRKVWNAVRQITFVSQWVVMDHTKLVDK